MHVAFWFKDAVISFKLEIRLHPHQVGWHKHIQYSQKETPRLNLVFNQFANLVAFSLHVNLARIGPNWLKTKFSPGISFWLYCTIWYQSNF